jgi:CheY-like chemotaxis protein
MHDLLAISAGAGDCFIPINLHFASWWRPCRQASRRRMKKPACLEQLQPILATVSEQVTKIHLRFHREKLFSTNRCSLTTQQKTLRVLVVDDDSDHATSLAILLGEYGYDSQVCLHANDCMEAVERWRPHVILLDLGMPGMTGFDIADEIQRNPDLRPVRLVAVTGHGQESVRQQTTKYGFDHHLLKPVDFQELETILKAVEVSEE